MAECNFEMSSIYVLNFCLPKKMVFHQKWSSIKSCHSLKGVFHQRSSSIKDCPNGDPAIKSHSQVSFSPESAQAIKAILRSRKISGLVWALKVHEPYIRHQNADTESPRAYIDNTWLWHARMGKWYFCSRHCGAATNPKNKKMKNNRSTFMLFLWCLRMGKWIENSHFVKNIYKGNS